MTYRIRTSRRADAYLRRLDPATEGRIAERLDEIAAEPYGGHSKVLVNVGGRRSSRVGDYRIVYSINDAERVVDVDAIGPRGRVYRNL